MAGQTHPRWQALLDWLALHGMDTSPVTMLVQARASPGAGNGLFALRDIDCATRLFSVPSSALLNIVTLEPLYPRARHQLTAIQLMSLHLFFYRPVDLGPSTDPVFGPYISTLPQDFFSHPLTWLCNENSRDTGSVLLSSLPPSISLALHEVFNRFHEDWDIVKQYIQQNNFLSSISEVARPIRQSLETNSAEYKASFLWAWLNVNTRCLYYHLEPLPSDKNNVTLCPVIDFANHTSRSNHMSPQLSNTDRTKTPLKTLRRDFAFLSPSSSVTRKDDELLLTYGEHSNQTLFVEYGFVNDISTETLSPQISVQSAVLDLFRSRGELGAWMKEILLHEGYWGDWTLHCQPSPAHPSFRLITALRLYHLFPVSETKVPPGIVSALRPWKATTMGTSENVSKENEVSWRNSLLHICQTLASDATSAIVKLEQETGSDGPSWIPWARQNIKTLWMEELLVSNMVTESILRHEEF